MYRKFKRRLVVLVTSSLVLTSISLSQPISNAASSKEEIPTWAAEDIAYWVNAGLLQGKADGLVHPEDVVTKAEFVTFVNRVFNNSLKSTQSFRDVPADAWYASEISKAFAAKILEGDGEGIAGPEDTMTREKAAVIISRAFMVKGSENSSPNFIDDKQISSWAQKAVQALKKLGYVSGFPDGSFKPEKLLTRAEAIKMINNVMGTLVADAAAHSNVTGKNLVVNTGGSVLSNINLSGDLYITAGVGEGDVTIKNANIKGTVYVLGGGTHSVVLENSTLGNIIVNKQNGEVRVFLSGTSSVENVDIQTESILELDSTATVENLDVNAPTEVKGEGEIKNATVNADGTTFEKAPVKMEVTVDHVVVDGKEVKKGEQVAVIPGAGTPNNGNENGNQNGNENGNENGNSNELTPGADASISKLNVYQYTYDDVKNRFPSTAAEKLVKQYINFMQDPTYSPTTANTAMASSVPNLTNAKTYVNEKFDVKPSIFASIRGVNTSVLDSSREYLWIGTNTGVTRINLTTNAMVQYTAEKNQLTDNHVLLLIPKGNGIYAITDNGVSLIIPALDKYSNEDVFASFDETGSQGLVKQYLSFMADPTYSPTTANTAMTSSVPTSLTNAKTYVNEQFNVKPSIFASMRGVNTSVMNDSRTYLWIGTNTGVTKINLSTNAMTNYTKNNGQLLDDHVLLLIADGESGVYAITDQGVSYITQ